jgi:hypothetical protein
LIIRAYSINLDISFAHMISKKMVSNINMLGSRVLNRIVCNLDSASVVERATEFCFLDDQETSDRPSN